MHGDCAKGCADVVIMVKKMFVLQLPCMRNLALCHSVFLTQCWFYNISSLCCLNQDTDDGPDVLVKHQTNISELKRTFLEQGGDKPGLTEWEKRLSSSPLRSPRLDDAPMIEPLLPDEVSN